MAAFCKPLMTLLCMQLGLATSLLKYKPEMHDSWVDPKVRPLQSFNTLCMRTPILPSCIRLPAAAYHGSERIVAAHLLLTRAGCAQPSLATLLAKPDKGMGMHDSILASTNGQTRKLRSYFPDPTMDIDNKVRSQSRWTDALL